VTVGDGYVGLNINPRRAGRSAAARVTTVSWRKIPRRPAPSLTVIPTR
jgi:hypothetical protein